MCFANYFYYLLNKGKTDEEFDGRTQEVAAQLLKLNACGGNLPPFVTHTFDEVPYNFYSIKFQ